MTDAITFLHTPTEAEARKVTLALKAPQATRVNAVTVIATAGTIWIGLKLTELALGPVRGPDLNILICGIVTGVAAQIIGQSICNIMRRPAARKAATHAAHLEGETRFHISAEGLTRENGLGQSHAPWSAITKITDIKEGLVLFVGTAPVFLPEAALLERLGRDEARAQLLAWKARSSA